MFSEQRISSSDLKAVLELGSTESLITADSEGRELIVISSIIARKAEVAGLTRPLKIISMKNTLNMKLSLKSESARGMSNVTV